MLAKLEVVIQTEKFGQFYPDAQRLFKEHWDENIDRKDLLWINPSIEVYKRLEDTNSLCIITVRKDSELIGYMVFLVQPSLHCKHILTAISDIYLLKKEYRNSNIALRMFRFAEEELKKRGVSLVHMCTKVDAERDRGPILRYFGYQLEDAVYCKRLD